MKKATKRPPEGSKLVFTLVPRGPLVDGSEAKPLTYERGYDKLLGGVDNGMLPDIPAGLYTLTGVETHPDGSRQPLLFQVAFAKYAESIDVAPAQLTTDFFPQQVGFTRD